MNKRLRDCRLLMQPARQLLRVTAFEAVGSDQYEKIPGPTPVAGHLFYTSRGFSQQDTLVQLDLLAKTSTSNVKLPFKVRRTDPVIRQRPSVWCYAGQLINTALPVPLTRLRIKDLAENKPNLLPERSVKEATGVTSEIYRSIEAALGVRLVNLVYRHLATIPGALEWAWAVVGDGFSEGIYQQRSAPLVRLGTHLSTDPQSIRPISLVDYGLGLSEASAVIETLDAYNRANPMNALSLRVIALSLSTGWCPPMRRADIASSRPLVDLLPMAGLEDLDPETSEYMTELALYSTGEKSSLVPSLFRHFFRWPAFLAGLCEWLRPLHEKDVVQNLSWRISDEADSIANDIFKNLAVSKVEMAPPAEEIRSAVVKTIAQFLPALCRMIVIGGLLRSAIVYETPMSADREE